MGKELQRYSGQIELSGSMFDAEQAEALKQVVRIVDRNPVLDWTQTNHNSDFITINGKVEVVKNFCLKAQYIAGLSMANTDVQFQGDGKNLRVIAKVKIWKDDTGRSVELVGAATVRETLESKYGKVNRRAFHDAVARAQTRAFKSTLEAFLGFPFINAAIQMVFGGFEMTGMPEDEGIDYGTNP